MGTSTCLLCGSTQRFTRTVADAKDGLPIDIACCLQCGFAQLGDVPDAEELASFYAEDYRMAYRNSRTPKSRTIYWAAQAGALRFAGMRNYVQPGMRHLDIGAGGGEMVALATMYGLNSQGIDINGDYLEFGRDAYRVPLEIRGIDDLKEDENFDVITLFHVLEHLPDPVNAVATIHRHLNDGGIFVVEVPNLENNRQSPANTFFKAHIGYYTGRTLRALLEKGFDVELLENRNVLYAIARKRPVDWPDRLDLDDPDSAEWTQNLVRNKKMWRYLLLNRGVLSPFRKVRSRAKMLSGKSGRTPPDMIREAFQQHVGPVA